MGPAAPAGSGPSLADTMAAGERPTSTGDLISERDRTVAHAGAKPHISYRRRGPDRCSRRRRSGPGGPWPSGDCPQDQGRLPLRADCPGSPPGLKGAARRRADGLAATLDPGRPAVGDGTGEVKAEDQTRRAVVAARARSVPDAQGSQGEWRGTTDDQRAAGAGQERAGHGRSPTTVLAVWGSRLGCTGNLSKADKPRLPLVGLYVGDVDQSVSRPLLYRGLGKWPKPAGSGRSCHRPGVYHRSAYPILVRLHQQDGRQAQALLRGFCSRASRLRPMAPRVGTTAQSRHQGQAVTKPFQAVKRGPTLTADDQRRPARAAGHDDDEDQDQEHQLGR
jgi:hypothetical protein